MRERDVEAYLVRECEKQGWLCLKYSDGLSGYPDRMVLTGDGRVAWVETKTEGGALSEVQRYTGAMLRRRGYSVYVPWTKREVDEVVEGIKKGDRP